MKRTVSILLSLIMIAALLAGCTSEPTDSNASSGDLIDNNTTDIPQDDPVEDQPTDEPTDESTNIPVEDEPVNDEPTEEPVTIRLGGLKGPTTIGMLKLISDAEAGTTENTYTYTLAGAADELSPKLLKGELDIIAAPVNLASILYNNSNGAVQFAAVNTLGVVYIVEKGGETVNSVADLAGKTIYATGKGQVPEYALRYLLSANGLDPENDVTIEWKSEPTEVVALMNQSDNALAMLPQPFVTVAQSQVEGLRIAVNLVEAWESLDNGSLFITAGLIVRREFIEQYPQQFAKFLEEYAASTEYANTNVEETAALCEAYDIVKAPVAAKAIPYCNITFLDGEEMSTAVAAYLQILFDLNPQAVGGALPGDDFYYVAE